MNYIAGFYRKVYGAKKHGYGNDRRRLNRLLKKAGIPFKWEYCWDGYKWTFPACEQWPDGDCVIHSGSYGHTHGMFETMGIGPECDCVARTAKELIELLVEHE